MVVDGLSILVVDDDVEMCKMMNKFLRKEGHKVKTVNSGREAIMLAKIGEYDLVLCDIAMPGVYGYDVVEALNKLEKRPKIGIITGWGENVKPVDEEGYNVDFITKKPFDFEELTKKIYELFGNAS
jgi:CheY-like chemotaxis protein|tara:strand:- start:220 stop:597 length:378 start_codon:yes stop_codon:yes gene_type:complete